MMANDHMLKSPKQLLGNRMSIGFYAIDQSLQDMCTLHEMTYQLTWIGVTQFTFEREFIDLTDIV
jgi:hypothetical protein